MCVPICRHDFGTNGARNSKLRSRALLDFGAWCNLMHVYLLQGVIHPRRAQIAQHSFALKFQHVSTGNRASLRARILMNELSIRVESTDDWDIFDLKNVARYITQTDLAIIAYLTGCAYTVEIVRITCQEKKLDVVYGIDIPSITNRSRDLDFETALTNLRQLCVAEGGVYFQRCMNDLLLAMQHPEDTAFFCYRAIEALKNHSVSTWHGQPKNTSSQWQFFRDIVKCEKEDLDFIKREADPLRHANRLIDRGEDREVLFMRTWEIVEKYVRAAFDKQANAVASPAADL
jgi:hypothetical protein